MVDSYPHHSGQGVRYQDGDHEDSFAHPTFGEEQGYHVKRELAHKRNVADEFVPCIFQQQTKTHTVGKEDGHRSQSVTSSTKQSACEEKEDH